MIVRAYIESSSICREERLYGAFVFKVKDDANEIDVLARAIEEAIRKYPGLSSRSDSSAWVLKNWRAI